MEYNGEFGSVATWQCFIPSELNAEKKTNKHVTVESVDEPDCVDGQPARGVHVLFPFH